MKTSEQVLQAAKKYYGEVTKDKDNRFRSWEHCYIAFHNARKASSPDIDFLSLQLAFYLASWGMYRGSSFLLQKDYSVHALVVKEILKKKYDPLFGVKCIAYRDSEYLALLDEISEAVRKHYDTVRLLVMEKSPQNELSDMLVTKVLLGTLGCVPAYDRYFNDGVKRLKASTSNYSHKSLFKLIDLYEENYAAFEGSVTQSMKNWADKKGSTEP